jgi:hypothetical protein
VYGEAHFMIESEPKRLWFPVEHTPFVVQEKLISRGEHSYNKDSIGPVEMDEFLMHPNPIISKRN